jgi:predicted TIM-barrel fold metal-dependent hydrolase
MRIVALEEHYTVPSLLSRIDPAKIVARGYPPVDAPSPRPEIDDRLKDFGEERIRLMDEAGISLQVLAMSGPGADLLSPSEGPAWARDINDALAAQVAAKPKRYAGFAHLPLTAPDAAADELERAVKKLGFLGAMVNGTTDGLFLDDARFEPILARAEALDVPIYIHPGIPPKAIRDAYYDNLKGPLPAIFSRAGWGWHAETAVHVVRLALSGALDRHPKLTIIIGHQGEGLPAMLDRFDETFASATPKFMQRTVSQTILDQVHVTTSGFYNLPSFLLLLQTFGADRIMFSVDYPFSSNATARKFLDSIHVSPIDREKIAHGNADKLLKLKADV